MSCSFNNRLSAYFDGELDAATTEAVRRHVEGCAECAAELAELKKLTGMFEQSPPPRLSQIALYRLHNNADVVVRGDVLRVARFVRAVAACVLVGSWLWLANGSGTVPTAQETVQTAPPWLDVAVTATAETHSLDTTTPAATWYLADASSRSDE
jgi:anti-sigma factor RsiW